MSSSMSEYCQSQLTAANGINILNSDILLVYNIVIYCWLSLALAAIFAYNPPKAHEEVVCIYIWLVGNCVGKEIKHGLG